MILTIDFALDNIDGVPYNLLLTPAISGVQIPKESMFEILMVKLENVISKKLSPSQMKTDDSSFSEKLIIRESVVSLPT